MAYFPLFRIHASLPFQSNSNRIVGQHPLFILLWLWGCYVAKSSFAIPEHQGDWEGNSHRKKEQVFEEKVCRLHEQKTRSLCWLNEAKVMHENVAVWSTMEETNDTCFLDLVLQWGLVPVFTFLAFLSSNLPGFFSGVWIDHMFFQQIRERLSPVTSESHRVWQKHQVWKKHPVWQKTESHQVWQKRVIPGVTKTEIKEEVT